MIAGSGQRNALSVIRPSGRIVRRHFDGVSDVQWPSPGIIIARVPRGTLVLDARDLRPLSRSAPRLGSSSGAVVFGGAAWTLEGPALWRVPLHGGPADRVLTPLELGSGLSGIPGGGRVDTVPRAPRPSARSGFA